MYAHVPDAIAVPCDRAPTGYALPSEGWSPGRWGTSSDETHTYSPAACRWAVRPITGRPLMPLADAACRCRLPMPLADAAYRCRLPMPLTMGRLSGFWATVPLCIRRWAGIPCIRAQSTCRAGCLPTREPSARGGPCEPGGHGFVRHGMAYHVPGDRPYTSSRRSPRLEHPSSIRASKRRAAASGLRRVRSRCHSARGNAA